jgi:hypothetical protein
VKLKHTEFFYAPEELGMSIIVCLEFVVPRSGVARDFSVRPYIPQSIR